MNKFHRDTHLGSLQRFISFELRAFLVSIAKAAPESLQARKDDARDFTRFVRNAGIVELLQDGFDPLETKSQHTTDPCQIEQKLRELEDAAHPRSGRPYVKSPRSRLARANLGSKPFRKT